MTYELAHAWIQKGILYAVQLCSNEWFKNDSKNLIIKRTCRLKHIYMINEYLSLIDECSTK